MHDAHACSANTHHPCVPPALRPRPLDDKHLCWEPDRPTARSLPCSLFGYGNRVQHIEAAKQFALVGRLPKPGYAGVGGGRGQGAKPREPAGSVPWTGSMRTHIFQQRPLPGTDRPDERAARARTARHTERVRLPAAEARPIAGGHAAPSGAASHSLRRAAACTAHAHGRPRVRVPGKQLLFSSAALICSFTWDTLLGLPTLAACRCRSVCIWAARWGAGTLAPPGEAPRLTHPS